MQPSKTVEVNKLIFNWLASRERSNEEIADKAVELVDTTYKATIGNYTIDQKKQMFQSVFA